MGVFAAGDATALPIKHGSLAAQQGDTAAAGIAHLAGAGPAPPAFRPVLNGTLLTGDEPPYLTAHLVAGASWTGRIHTQPPGGPSSSWSRRNSAPTSLSYGRERGHATARTSIRPPDTLTS
jgi:hypothetical protein